MAGQRRERHLWLARGAQEVEQLRGRNRPTEKRALRAIAVLKHSGTTEARAILAALAKATRVVRLAQEAKASLERLAQRSATRP